MRIQVFKQNEDGTIDFFNSKVTHQDSIPEGYVQIPKEDSGKYKDDGTKLTQEELDAIHNIPKQPTEKERIEALEQAMLEVAING